VDPALIYALPTLALFATANAAVPLGIARHAIDLFTGLARSKVASRSRQTLDRHSLLQADLGRAEALVRAGRAFLYDALDEAWATVSAGRTLAIQERAMLWLAATEATSAATKAVELLFSAGGSASLYAPPDSSAA
jgi:alkylation response protein AidB-like acyl-CoA dehydrogenase